MMFYGPRVVCKEDDIESCTEEYTAMPYIIFHPWMLSTLSVRSWGLGVQASAFSKGILCVTV